MARGDKRGARASGTKPIEQYEHADKKRANNPQVGLVGPGNDPNCRKNKYAYDPHVGPKATWEDKSQYTAFEVPIVSLHANERIDPMTILDEVNKASDADSKSTEQRSLFARPDENPPSCDTRELASP